MYIVCALVLNWPSKNVTNEKCSNSLNVMDFPGASQTRDITMCICSFGHLSGVYELNIKIQNEKQLVNQKILP